MDTCACEGQPLVEVFGVRYHGGGEAPAGTVSIYDGKRGQIIYSGGPVDKPSSRQTQVEQRVSRSCGRLPLTGPYRAISADGCVSIVLDLHHRRYDTRASWPTLSPPLSCVDEIHLDVYAEATRYDEAITSAVGSTCGDGPDVEVTYALLSDAAEAIVEVTLLRRGLASGAVNGKIVARTYVGEVLLFDDNGASVGAQGVIPLARSVVAVPLTSALTIELDLVVDGDDEEFVVKESLVCAPKLGREEVNCSSIVEVKVTWLD